MKNALLHGAVKLNILTEFFNPRQRTTIYSTYVCQYRGLRFPCRFAPD